MRKRIFILCIVLISSFGCAQTMYNTPVSTNMEVENAMSNTESEKISDRMQPILDQALDLCQASQEFWQKGELENALGALDQAYSLILEVETHDVPKLIQQKEDLRFMISKRILEIHASRTTVVNGKHNAIPLTLNKYVQKEIDRFTSGREIDFFVESYKRSGKYRPQILKELKKAGLPAELSWLPLIESGYKANALSRARALGLWQFISSTGYKFGLKRDKYIDERLDFEKSTIAATQYLNELHQIFGDWTTALAAYNCGEGKVLRVIRSQNINYLDNFWDLYELLPRETRRYVPRFLATLHIVQNPKKYGMENVVTYPPLQYDILQVSKQVHLKNVAKEIGTTENQLRELNPELRYRILPSENYDLRVPPGTTEILLSKIDTIPVSSPPKRAYIYHRVRYGETLSTIARRYRTRVSSIMRVNNLRRSNFIVAGKILKIPLSGSTGRYQPAKKKQVSYKLPATHVVKSGDSLYNIAKRYGTTVKKIQQANNLPSTDLDSGQVLRIPANTVESPPLNAAKTYKVYLVRKGDTPFNIAQQHNMSMDRLLQINHLSARSKIYPGQTLYVD